MEDWQPASAEELAKHASDYGSFLLAMLGFSEDESAFSLRPEQVHILYSRHELESGERTHLEHLALLDQEESLTAGGHAWQEHGELYFFRPEPLLGPDADGLAGREPALRGLLLQEASTLSGVPEGFHHAVAYAALAGALGQRVPLMRAAARYSTLLLYDYAAKRIAEREPVEFVDDEGCLIPHEEAFVAGLLELCGDVDESGPLSGYDIRLPERVLALLAGEATQRGGDLIALIGKSLGDYYRSLSKYRKPPAELGYADTAVALRCLEQFPPELLRPPEDGEPGISTRVIAPDADIEELLAEPALTGEDRRRLKVYEPAVELLLHGSALERVESLASEYARFTETLDSMPTHHIEGRTARLAFQRDWRCYVGSDAPVRLDGERLQGLNLLSHPYFKDQEVLAFEKAVIGMVGSREERASSETFLKDFFVRHRRNAKRWDGRRSGRK